VTTLSATVVATIPELASNQPRAEYAVSLWAHNVQWLVDRGHPANRVIQTEVVDRGLVSPDSPEHRYLLAFALAHYEKAKELAAERRAALYALDS
jgi:hypothetical protein